MWPRSRQDVVDVKAVLQRTRVEDGVPFPQPVRDEGKPRERGDDAEERGNETVAHLDAV